MFSAIQIPSIYDFNGLCEKDLIRIYEIPNVGFGIVWLYVESAGVKKKKLKKKKIYIIKKKINKKI